MWQAEHWEGAQHGVLQEQPGPCTQAGQTRSWPSETAACPQAGSLTGSFVSQNEGCRAQVNVLLVLGLLLPGYFESWSSLAFCKILQTSEMG